MGLMKDLATEPKSEHCKVYIEQSLKAIIQKYADARGITFSAAGRKLWLEAVLILVNENERLS